MRVKSSLGVRIFELTEFEWYGDNLETAGPRQANVIEAALKDAYESSCRYVVIFVTPDDLFSVSPTAGRHKVFSENLSPIVGNLEVSVVAHIALERYAGASDESKKAMIKIVEDELISLTSHIPTKGVNIEYTIKTGSKKLRSFKIA